MKTVIPRFPRYILGTRISKGAKRWNNSVLFKCFSVHNESHVCHFPREEGQPPSEITPRLSLLSSLAPASCSTCSPSRPLRSLLVRTPSGSQKWRESCVHKMENMDHTRHVPRRREHRLGRRYDTSCLPPHVYSNISYCITIKMACKNTSKRYDAHIYICKMYTYSSGFLFANICPSRALVICSNSLASR